MFSLAFRAHNLLLLGSYMYSWPSMCVMAVERCKVQWYLASMQCIHPIYALGVQLSRDCFSFVFCMKPQRFENAQPSSVHFRLLRTAPSYCRFRIAAWYDRGRQMAYNSLRWWAGSHVPGLVRSQRCLVVSVPSFGSVSLQ